MNNTPLQKLQEGTKEVYNQVVSGIVSLVDGREVVLVKVGVLWTGVAIECRTSPGLVCVIIML